MWRKSACAVGGLVLACAAGYGVYSLNIDARQTSFDLRWIYPATKADRLPVSQILPSDQVTMAFQIPSEKTTIAAKGPARYVEESALHMTRIKVKTVPVNPVRTVPNDEERPANEKRKDKLLEGCEPSFSPVTAPALAHISGRCDS